MPIDDIKIRITADDQASGVLSKFSGNVDKLQPAFKKMAIAGTAGFAAIGGIIGISLKESIQAESAVNRLTQILKVSRGATDDQIKSLLNQAKALEKVGVVAEDNILIAQSQLATFDLEAESIERLIPAILDYATAEKGAAVSGEELKQMTNGLAQALQGNFASLTKTGFVLDEATKELIKNGTEAERTAALVTVLNSTYKGFNETARLTSEGALQVMTNEFSNMKQAIGDALLPVLADLIKSLTPLITKVSEWIEKHPDLTKNLLLAGLAITALTAAIGFLGLALPVIITGFTLMLGPVGAVIAVIGVLTTATILLVKHWSTIKEFFRQTWDGIKIIFDEAVTSVMNKLQPLLDFLSRVRDAFQSTINKAREAASNIGSGVGGFVGNVGNKLGFAEGGIVPGPIGAPVSATVHGGEMIIPPGKSGFGNINISITGTFLSEDAAERLTGLMVDKLKLELRI